MSSVRFICGTQSIHQQLEEKSVIFRNGRYHFYIPRVSMQTVVYFEAILTEDDAIISDALNHASIIDGVIM